MVARKVACFRRQRGELTQPRANLFDHLCIELKVPSIAPTISNCPLLKVDYAVEVHVSGKGQGLNDTDTGLNCYFSTNVCTG